MQTSRKPQVLGFQAMAWPALSWQKYGGNIMFKWSFCAAIPTQWASIYLIQSNPILSVYISIYVYIIHHIYIYI